MKIITFSLIASQTIAPLSSKEFIQDIDSQLIAFWGKEVSRVYCSSKSIGFDLHFNNKSGKLYSFNESLNKLEPFRIESEIPFKDIIPNKAVDDFLKGWNDSEIMIDTNITKDDLLIKMYSDFSPEDYIIAALNLKNLKLKIDLTRLSTGEEQIIAESVVSRIKCEYIEPESYKL